MLDYGPKYDEILTLRSAKTEAMHLRPSALAVDCTETQRWIGLKGNAASCRATIPVSSLRSPLSIKMVLSGQIFPACGQCHHRAIPHRTCRVAEVGWDTGVPGNLFDMPRSSLTART